MQPSYAPIISSEALPRFVRGGLCQEWENPLTGEVIPFLPLRVVNGRMHIVTVHTVKETAGGMSIIEIEYAPDAMTYTDPTVRVSYYNDSMATWEDPGTVNKAQGWVLMVSGFLMLLMAIAWVWWRA